MYHTEHIMVLFWIVLYIKCHCDIGTLLLAYLATISSSDTKKVFKNESSLDELKPNLCVIKKIYENIASIESNCTVAD